MTQQEATRRVREVLEDRPDASLEIVGRYLSICGERPTRPQLATAYEAAQTEFKIGSRVSYEDMANPRRYGVVCDIETTEWGVSYVIAWDDGHISQSDCRQRGWRIES